MVILKGKKVNRYPKDIDLRYNFRNFLWKNEKTIIFL